MAKQQPTRSNARQFERQAEAKVRATSRGGDQHQQQHHHHSHVTIVVADKPKQETAHKPATRKPASRA